MLTNSKIALSLALVLATVSAAAAAPRQAAHHQTTAQQQVPGGAHLSLDSVRSTGSARPTGLPNQPSNISAFEFERLAHLIEAIDEIGTKDYFGN